MENGEQVTMELNLPSCERYVYDPHRFFDFVEKNCRLVDHNNEFLNIKIHEFDHSFINVVLHSNKPHVIRDQGRRSGGTTLLSLLALFYTLDEHKSVTLISSSTSMALAWGHTLKNIQLLTHTVTGALLTGVIKINIKDIHDASESIIRIMANDHHLLYKLSGCHHDYIFIDGTGNINPHILNDMCSMLNSGGKVIENIS